jgi:redox-sensitive bicupin YhaK (pirin superfamily)
VGKYCHRPDRQREDRKPEPRIEYSCKLQHLFYVLDGSVVIGEDKSGLNEFEVGWLNLTTDDAAGELMLTAGKDGVRLPLYGGKLIGHPIVSNAPFIADSSEDIIRTYSEYMQGKMKKISVYLKVRDGCGGK